MTQATQTQGAASPPSGWVETTLGEIVKTNLSSISRDYPFDEILYLDTGSITENRIESLQKIKTKDAPSRAKRILQPNDIVYSNVRPVQKHFGVIENPQDNLVASTGFTTITTNIDKAFPKFIYYLISQDSAINFFQQIAEHSTSAYPSIRPEHIESFVINLPPLLEQRAIAGVLSAFDDKIELLREQNKTLEASAQAIFGEWFGKYSPDRPEDLPEGWRVGKIGEIIQRFSIPYKCTKSDLEPKGKTKIFDQGTSGLYGYTSRQPDFEASKENPVILFTNHTCNYWFVDYSFCAIQNVIPYRGKDNYDVYFLYFMTKGSIEFIEYKGHWPDFEAKDFIIPPANLAEKFSKFSKPILEKISENNSQIQTLSTFRDTLLPRLMRREVRVGF